MYVSTLDCCKEHNLKPLDKIIRAEGCGARERRAVIASKYNVGEDRRTGPKKHVIITALPRTRKSSARSDTAAITPLYGVQTYCQSHVN